MKVTLTRSRTFKEATIPISRCSNTDHIQLYSDQVSDAVLDACLAEDPLSKVRIAGQVPERDIS